MSRTIVDISWDDLDGIAQHAGAAAIDTAHDAGLSTFGVVDGVVVRVASDRSRQLLGPTDAIDKRLEVLEKASVRSVA